MNELTFQRWDYTLTFKRNLQNRWRAPRGRSSADAKSRTTGKTASNAEVARVSCSSGPLIPDVGIKRAGCHVSSLMLLSPALLYLLASLHG